MKFSYSAVWEDTVGLIRGNASVLIALAGVFIFLPALLMAYFLPGPQAPTMAKLIPLMREHLIATWHWMLLANIFNMAGTLAMMLLLFGKGGPTVGSTIAGAFALLPFYFLAAVLSSFLIGIGLTLFILPGAYLFGRMAPLAPVVAAEDRRNPIDAIRRSFEITRGNGWTVTGLIVIVAAAAFVTTFAITIIFGSTAILIAGQQIGGMMALIVSAVTSAAFSTLMIILFAAIYRQLTGANQA